ncbi:MAG: hypothetical protein AAF928_07430 [Myxococcota bacterium]
MKMPFTDAAASDDGVGDAPRSRAEEGEPHGARAVRRRRRPTGGTGAAAVLGGWGLFGGLGLGAVLGLAIVVHDVEGALAQPPPSASSSSQPAVTEERTPTTGVPWDEADGTANYKATQYYKAGISLFERKDFTGALAQFRSSYGEVRSPNSRLMVVRSLFELGRYEAAYREAMVLEEEAKNAAAKSPQKYEAAVTAAATELSAVKKKLAFVVVQAPAGATVTLNGDALPAARWGEAIIVAPGPVEVRMSRAAPGVAPVTESADAKAGQTVTLTLSAAETPPPAPKTPVGSETATVAVDDGYAGPDRISMAVVAGSVGVLGMATFGIFGALANGQFSRLEDLCDGTSCPERLEEEAEAGQRYQTAANVSVVVGALGLAGGAGLVLWEVLEPEAAAPRGDRALHWSVGPGSVSVSGRF